MPDSPTDDELLATLSAALGDTEPVPATVTEAARAVFTWRSIDGELAALVFDSDIESAVAGVRGDEEHRHMTFAAPGIEIEISVDGESRQVIGQLVPARSVGLTVTVGDQILEALTDELGRFHLVGVDPGPMRVSVPGLDDGPSVHTEWIVI